MMGSCAMTIELLAMTILSFTGVSSFIAPEHVQIMHTNRYPRPSSNTCTPVHLLPDGGASNMCTRHGRRRRTTMFAIARAPDEGENTRLHHAWSPQDLTKDSPGYLPIPDDDYVKKYQRNPELWPVEFFLIAHRRTKNKQTQRVETQILVRESANGTSQWGVGTGVPATRWLLCTQERPPVGYTWSEPPAVPMQEPSRISFDASNFPEFPKNRRHSWVYNKIDIREDAFNGPDATIEFKDPELEEYASKIRNDLRTELHERMNDGKNNLSNWESSTLSVIQNVAESANCLAAIQGTLRMSGLFAQREARDGSSSSRYVSLGKDAPTSAKLVQSMQIYTMFPQMPDPMPLPTTPPEELQKEIATREFRLAESGRDPHKDRYGRKFTHKSTSNVSNTIHGVYFTVDVTDLPGLDEVPALDLFGAKKIKRQWKSLEDLKVLDGDGKGISTEDTKPTFISGFIVRQLVKDGVIDILG